MSAASVAGQRSPLSSGAGPLGLMSCVRESSPPLLNEHDCDVMDSVVPEKHVASKKKFWNRLRWFRRKNKQLDDALPRELPQQAVYYPKETSLRSISTSELSIENSAKKRNSTSMHPGLSVSHDSVFHSQQSGSETDLEGSRSVSSLCILQPPKDDLQTELVERLRLRRGRGDTSEDDEGLPHSLCNSPTRTTTDDKTANKDLLVKSDPNDEFTASGEGSNFEEDDLDTRAKVPISEQSQDLDLGVNSFPLNHSAAHHRKALKPKRTHGLPRKKRTQITNTLPTTVEVNEDSSFKGSTNDVSKKENTNQAEIITNLPNLPIHKKITPETLLKSSSLPVGLAPPNYSDTKLNRSQSNASKSHDALEGPVTDKTERSFFDRFFLRRSAKKKKAKNQLIQDERKEKKIKTEVTIRESAQVEDKVTSKFNYIQAENAFVSPTKQTERRYETKPIPVVRSGAAYRQRVAPINIPLTPDQPKKEIEDSFTNPSPPEGSPSSPLRIELENILKTKQSSLAASYFSSTSITPPFKDEEEENHEQKSFDVRKSEINLPRIKLAGLSSLQQRVLYLNEDEEDVPDFNSLTELPSYTTKSNVSLVKSQSFKNVKKTLDTVTAGPKSMEFSSAKLKEMEISIDEMHSSIRSFKEESKKSYQVIEVDCSKTGDKNPQENNKEYPDVTISGPCHTAIISIKTNSNKSSLINDQEKKGESVSKINLNETLDSPTYKLEIVPTTPTKTNSNVNSPVVLLEHAKPKTVFNFITEKSNIKSNKNEESEFLSMSSLTESSDSVMENSGKIRYKKNDKSGSRKSSLKSTSDSPVREKSLLSVKSSSVDSINKDNTEVDKSSSDSLDNKSLEAVVMRKKIPNKDEEPELMKVFARRSLKLKDSDTESLSQNLAVMMKEECDKTPDSDKENISLERSTNEPDVPLSSDKNDENKTINKTLLKEDNSVLSKLKKNPVISKDVETENKKDKEITESNVVPFKLQVSKSNKILSISDEPDIMFKKPVFNSIFPYQRAVSLNVNRTSIPIPTAKKQNWCKSENWKNTEDSEKEDDKSEISEKEDEVVIEPKNFIQRKAEWEKRAQEAQRKSTI